MTDGLVDGHVMPALIPLETAALAHAFETYVLASGAHVPVVTDGVQWLRTRVHGSKAAGLDDVPAMMYKYQYSNSTHD